MLECGRIPTTSTNHAIQDGLGMATFRLLLQILNSLLMDGNLLLHNVFLHFRKWPNSESFTLASDNGKRMEP